MVVSYTSCMVRPALYLDLSQDVWSYAGTVDSSGTVRTGRDILTEENFPDAVFLEELKSRYPDGLTASEAAEVTSLDVSDYGQWEEDTNIHSLQGIEYFTELTVFYCRNNSLTALDLSGLTKLEQLSLTDNSLTALDVSGNTALTDLDCAGNALTALDVSKNIKLKTLYCSYNALTALDLSQNTALEDCFCVGNKLTALDVSGNTGLKVLLCSRNKLNALNVSGNTALNYLDCSNNSLTALELSRNTALSNLFCGSNKITKLDLGSNTALKVVSAANNSLTALDVSRSADLERLLCDSNKLTELDVSRNTKLRILHCSQNQIPDLDLSQNTALEDLVRDPARPAAPTLSKSGSTVTVKWKSIPGATQYLVQRKVGTGSWYTKATLQAGTLSWKDTASKTGGKKYSYRIKAVDEVGTSVGSEAKVTYYLAKPAAPTLTNLSSSVKVSWKQISGASGYYVYRKAGTGSWKKIAAVSSGSTVSYTDSKAVTNGQKYQYKIVAVKTVSGTVYKSSEGSVKTVYRLSRPSFTSALNSAAGKISLKWGKNSSATGYQIKYVTGTRTTTLDRITKNTTLSKTLSGLTRGKTYKLYIRSYRTVDGKNYYSAWSAYKSVKVAK